MVMVVIHLFYRWRGNVCLRWRGCNPYMLVTWRGCVIRRCVVNQIGPLHQILGLCLRDLYLHLRRPIVPIICSEWMYVGRWWTRMMMIVRVRVMVLVHVLCLVICRILLRLCLLLRYIVGEIYVFKAVNNSTTLFVGEVFVNLLHFEKYLCGNHWVWPSLMRYSDSLDI